MKDGNQLEKQLSLLAENVNTGIYNQRKYLLGRVLTIVDAVSSDPEQRKAIKDLCNDLFYQGSYWNEIKWHFQQLAKAHDFDILLDNPLTVQDPKNIYAEL